MSVGLPRREMETEERARLWQFTLTVFGVFFFAVVVFPFLTQRGKNPEVI